MTERLINRRQGKKLKSSRKSSVPFRRCQPRKTSQSTCPLGRVKKLYWYDYTSGTVDISRVKHGYDYASNRTWREDVVAAANSQDHDDFYPYDGLHPLTNAQRGNLTGTFPRDSGVRLGFRFSA